VTDPKGSGFTPTVIAHLQLMPGTTPAPGVK